MSCRTETDSFLAAKSRLEQKPEKDRSFHETKTFIDHNKTLQLNLDFQRLSRDYLIRVEFYYDKFEVFKVSTLC